jgi:TM2 domain-containing membrane protein YozV
MDNRILYGIMCIIFNEYGVPCFMRGDVKKGVLRIVLGVVTFGIVAIINFVKGIILGVKVLQMTDEEYARTDKSTLDSGIPA